MTNCHRRLLQPLLLLLLLLQLLQLTIVSADASPENGDDLLLAVMQLHGATDGNITRRQLQDIIDFAKNASKFSYIENLRRQLGHNISDCQNAESIINSTIGNGDASLTEAKLRRILPQILFAMQNPLCYEGESNRDQTDAIAWLYSAAAVLIMKVAALSGILTFPCMSERVYTMALAFLIPLAISSLLGSTLFIFLPDALNLPEIPHYDENFGTPILKLGAAGIGIYIFYLIEKLLRLVMERKEKRFYRNSRTRSQAAYNFEIANETLDRPSRKISTTMAGDISSFPSKKAMAERVDSRVQLADANQMQVQQQQPKAEAEVEEMKQQVAPIAWIALMGDCIRNFIDGTAIGAAFSLNVLTGVSLTVAFIFEEIPTELGDVAILLNAGMSLCRATMLHFFAATFAFIGAAAGILLGDLGSSQLWIFAVSAGAFLYIALVDLMPEMNHMLDSDKAKQIGRMKIFILQNIGLILGFVVTGLLGYYSESLHIDFGGNGHPH